MSRCFMRVLVSLCLVSAGLGVWTPSAGAQMLNRSLVSVGSDVYTWLDARLILALWNSVSAPKVPLTTDFAQPPVAPGPTPKAGGDVKGGADIKGGAAPSAADRMARLAPDAKRLLYILFVWDESRRLGLFAPSDKALKEGFTAIQTSGFAAAAPPEVLVYWNDLGAQGQRLYVDMILRAQTFLKVRGDLESNQRLAEAPWYWHGIARE